MIENALLENKQETLLIADFASGENDEVPLFFHTILPKCMGNIETHLLVYCMDIHSLRIESLFDKLIEHGLVSNTRIVAAKFESMIESARFPDIQLEYLNTAKGNQTWLDEDILKKRAVPMNCFDIGILNNDVIGYVSEYYKEYTDARKSIEGIRNALRTGAILIVTQPCLLYPVDNIKILSGLGFKFMDGLDIDLSTGTATVVTERTPPASLSRLGHYTFLVFETE